jgi:four helix bundle protein
MANYNQPNAIVELSFRFALKIVQYTSILEANRRYVIARQLLRSGTSIGANIRESQNAESKADFVHKLKISAKEAGETEYWLMLCRESGYGYCDDLISDCKVIIKVLSSIIATTKKTYLKKY